MFSLLLLTAGPINPVAEDVEGSVAQEQGDTVVARAGLLGVFLGTQVLKHCMDCHSGEFAETALLCWCSRDTLRAPVSAVGRSRGPIGWVMLTHLYPSRHQAALASSTAGTSLNFIN